MRVLLLVLGFLWFGHEIQAQILNIEKSRMDNDTLEAFIGNASLNFRLQQKNVQVISARNTLNLTHATKQHNYILIGNLHLIKIEERDVISDGSVHLRWNILKRKKFSYELFAQGQYDEARGLKHRYLAGGDVRARLRYSDKITLAAATGLMYENERWALPDQEIEENREFIKSTTYFSIQNRFTKSLEINCISYYQARLDRFFQPRITADVNMNLRISKVFSFNSKFSMIYDAIPVVPIRKLFYTFSNGLTVKF